jgi:hypothetical protein
LCTGSFDWTIVTITTVGYGDISPETPLGKTLASVIMLLGYAIVAVPNPAVTPPDIHHQSGLHCIDCHVRREIMGDGNIYGHMDQATEVECEDCHRNPAALGLGTGGFKLSRTYLFTLTPAPAGSLIIINRKDVAAASVVATLPLPDPRGLSVLTDQVDGAAKVAYVADGDRGLVAIDLSDPAHPQAAAPIAAADARDVAVAGQHLYLAAGTNGVLTYDVSSPLQPQLLGSLQTREARAVAVHGLLLLVADGPGGLAVIDAKVPAARAADVILTRLVRSFRNTPASTPAYLDDYASLVLGLSDLYAATFDTRWLRQADRLSRDMLRLFADPPVEKAKTTQESLARGPSAFKERPCPCEGRGDSFHCHL